jgi:hypothetical protein
MRRGRPTPWRPADGTSGDEVHGRRDEGDPASRVDLVDEWARFLSVTPTWEELPGGAGEYSATGWHMGVRVTVRAWLPSPPLEVKA